MIVLVDPEENRSALRKILVGFHEWMAEHDDAYNPEKELTEDFESLIRERDSWAWIARSDGEPAGSVLLYGETETLAEFRRLWVRPAHRGKWIGRTLTRTVIEKAQAEGYETLGLTTPLWADASHALYESMGFEHHRGDWDIGFSRTCDGLPVRWGRSDSPAATLHRKPEPVETLKNVSVSVPITSAPDISPS